MLNHMCIKSIKTKVIYRILCFIQCSSCVTFTSHRSHGRILDKSHISYTLFHSMIGFASHLQAIVHTVGF